MALGFGSGIARLLVSSAAIPGVCQLAYHFESSFVAGGDIVSCSEDQPGLTAADRLKVAVDDCNAKSLKFGWPSRRIRSVNSLSLSLTDLAC